MFSKQSKAVPRPTPSKALATSAPQDLAVRKTPEVASVVAKDMTIEGSLIGEGELHVDGTVRGDVRVSRLTIGESGVIEGTVSAELVEARGTVVGSITAKQIRLFATAHVDGDITHEQLAMETGASFQGRSLKFQRPAPTPLREAGPTGPMAEVINIISAPTSKDS